VDAKKDEILTDPAVRDRLLRMRAEFRRRIEAIRRDMEAPLERDFEEQGVQRENDQVLTALLVEAEVELGRVNLALARLAEGKYGICVRCGADISLLRLAAVPQTDICQDCARNS
jgi:RNA polymerase-binding transcription factor DksA